MPVTPNILWIGALFGLLFVAAELLHRHTALEAESTRKLTHIGTGLLAMLFPCYLGLVEVGILCALFFIILVLSKRRNLLGSINGITRKSFGSTLYPVAVFLAFWYDAALQASHFYYAAPILMLALCDPFAAFAGRWWKRKSNIVSARKTIAGSGAFAALGLLIITALYYFFPQANTGLPLILLLPAAIVGALAERWSKNGWDNLTIPISVLLYFTTIGLIIFSHNFS